MAHILIADDEPHIIRVMRMSLEQAGYEVQFVHNGAEALESILKTPPLALITDIDMPVLNGKELCQKIQQEIPDREFPIFVISSKTNLEHRQWTRDIENLSFVEKPLSLRKLISALQDTLGNTFVQ